MNDNLTVIISKDQSDRDSRKQLQQEIADALVKRPGVTVLTVPHLYYLSADGPGIDAIRAVKGPMIVVSWLYARAAFWTLAAAGVEGRLANGESTDGEDDDRRAIWCFDLHKFRTVDALLEKLEPILARSPAETASPGEAAEVDEEAGFRWYPVLDYDKCRNCLECLNFCLFGVFATDASDRIFVEQPDACRNGCPACARVCPSGAIIFPHHSDPSIAGGAAPPSAGGLMPMLGGPGNAEQAAAERDRALAEQPSAKDELDELVDELDRFDP